MPNLTRRHFLKLAASGALGLLLPGVATKLALAGPLPPRSFERPLFYGRALLIYVTVYRTPSIYAGHVARVDSHSVLPIYEEVEGENGTAGSNRWFRTDGGFVHVSNVQPCQWRYNPARDSLDSAGELVELTVPFVSAYPRPRIAGERKFRLYYGTTYWAYSATIDDLGQTWYELRDDRKFETYYAPAEAFRFVQPEDVAPLFPDATDKKVVLYLKEQRLEAWANGAVQFAAPMSSGAVFTNADGEEADFSTPLGNYVINRKRPERRMADGDLVSNEDAFDLPGIPWVGYFNGGIAFHGCYWHNHYGQPMSHGCINLPPEHSQYIYRFTQPYLGLDEKLVERARGTRIEVVA